jgi:hypothetical protein
MMFFHHVNPWEPMSAKALDSRKAPAQSPAVIRVIIEPILQVGAMYGGKFSPTSPALTISFIWTTWRIESKTEIHAGKMLCLRAYSFSFLASSTVTVIGFSQITVDSPFHGVHSHIVMHAVGRADMNGIQVFLVYHFSVVCVSLWYVQGGGLLFRIQLIGQRDHLHITQSSKGFDVRCPDETDTDYSGSHFFHTSILLHSSVREQASHKRVVFLSELSRGRHAIGSSRRKYAIDVLVFPYCIRQAAE